MVYVNVYGLQRARALMLRHVTICKGFFAFESDPPSQEHRGGHYGDKQAATLHLNTPTQIERNTFLILSLQN